MIITKKKLLKLNACSEGIIWFERQNITDCTQLFNNALADKKYSWLNWLLARLMNKKQRVTYAIYAAELVIDIFEKKYPDDDRPRKAIEAAKAYLKRPSGKTKNAAAYAAYAAAYAAAAAAYAADAYAAAARAAADAAAAAAAAARAAADDAAAAAAAYAAAAAAAAYAAAYAADAAAAAYAAAAREETYKKILEFGFNLLKGEKI